MERSGTVTSVPSWFPTRRFALRATQLIQGESGVSLRRSRGRFFAVSDDDDSTCTPPACQSIKGGNFTPHNTRHHHKDREKIGSRRKALRVGCLGGAADDRERCVLPFCLNLWGEILPRAWTSPILTLVNHPPTQPLQDATAAQTAIPSPPPLAIGGSAGPGVRLPTRPGTITTPPPPWRRPERRRANITRGGRIEQRQQGRGGGNGGQRLLQRQAVGSQGLCASFGFRGPTDRLTD